MNTTQINGLKDFEPALFTGHLSVDYDTILERAESALEHPEVCHYCERAQVVA